MAKKNSAESIHHSQPNYIVGIGASAGGLEALEAFFSGMPVDSGMSFVVIQHLAPDFKSLMDELLARCTTMPIYKSENKMPIEPNSIYLIPPKKEMIVKDNTLFLRERNVTRGVLNLPIDIFFQSLAEDYKINAIGVVLSGTGSDGSRGICAIHEHDGLVLCQTPESASFDGMPNSAIATGIVDIVANPNEMPDLVVEYTTHRHQFIENQRQKMQGQDGDIFADIFVKLNEVYDVDFVHYKPNTITRRIERRMSLTRQLTVNDYLDYLVRNDDELGMLYRDLLIGVTQFFRDEEYWKYVASDIIPDIFDKNEGNEVRIWVPACASGEEAYSMAILLHEYVTSHHLALTIRIFATDLHKNSLSLAGKGVYPKASLNSMGLERINRYFIETENGTYEIAPDIRRMVVFAQHNILKDPPFTKIDFISCRNLLIYFNANAQKRVISFLHFALNVNGYLFLGPSESLGDIRNEFKEVHRRYKIYKKRRDIKLRENLSVLPQTKLEKSGNIILRNQSPHLGTIGGRDINLIRAYDILLQQYVPPSLLIEHNGTLAYTFGDATDYLVRPKGLSTLNILENINPDLRTVVSTGLQKTTNSSSSVSYGGISVRLSNGETRVVRVSITPLSELKPSDYVLITFDDYQVSEKITSKKAFELEDQVLLTQPQKLTSDYVNQIEEELRYTKENLQATVEELETSNEELQATNEELMASNEELQSTNEELHSVNEELYTVNREYEEKIEELVQLNDDMDNLLSATNIGTVFLDANLKIRKFTPAAAQQFSLMAQDVGRPISHLNKNIEFDDFQLELEEVRKSGASVTHEVRNQDNRWFLMGIHPYTNDKGETDGIVVTFVEISLIKEFSLQISQKNEDLQSFAYAISHDLNEPVRILTKFSELLVKDVTAMLEHKIVDAEKLDFIINQINDSSVQLREMLDGTLKFSRIVSQGVPFTTVDLADCLAQAKQKLHPQIAKHHVTINATTLPMMEGDATQLSRVFQELIENSIKFKKDGEDVNINISCDTTDHNISIVYEDKSRGIKINQPERIFNIFFKHHYDNQTGGLGLGLSMCKRIVERHQGTILFVPEHEGTKFLIQFER